MEQITGNPDYVSITEERRRATLTPTERFQEDVAKGEAEFDEGMAKLKRLTKALFSNSSLTHQNKNLGGWKPV